jgi:hypothetical protein
VKTEGKADFQVAFLVALRDRVDISSWGYGYRGHGWGGSDLTVRSYTEGTLLIDIIDPAKNELIWRGTAVGAVDEGSGSAERATEVVNSILERFPPKK